MPETDVTTPWLSSARKSASSLRARPFRAGAVDGAVIGERLVAHVEEDQ